MYLEPNNPSLSFANFLDAAIRDKAEIKPFPYTLEVCRCRYCSYCQNGKCALKRCCCMSERVKAKSCTFAELLRDCFVNFKDNVFQFRLRIACERASELKTCLRYGVSFVVAGRTSSGKTTLLNSLLGSIHDSKRIYTIESGARELSLVKRDEQGRVINNVVHTLSRPSDKDIYDITQEDLVMAALRFDPDVICVGEMRDAEAHSAVEASSTDHTVVTTVHGGGGRYAHRRIAFLSQRSLPEADIHSSVGLPQALQRQHRIARVVLIQPTHLVRCMRFGLVAIHRLTETM